MTALLILGREGREISYRRPPFLAGMRSAGPSEMSASKSPPQGREGREFSYMAEHFLGGDDETRRALAIKDLSCPAAPRSGARRRLAPAVCAPTNAAAAVRATTSDLAQRCHCCLPNVVWKWSRQTARLSHQFEVVAGIGHRRRQPSHLGRPCQEVIDL
jgi:hypothetical protein